MVMLMLMVLLLLMEAKHCGLFCLRQPARQTDDGDDDEIISYFIYVYTFKNLFMLPLIRPYIVITTFVVYNTM